MHSVPILSPQRAHSFTWQKPGWLPTISFYDVESMVVILLGGQSVERLDIVSRCVVAFLGVGDGHGKRWDTGPQLRWLPLFHG